MAVKAIEKPTLSTYAMKVARKQAKMIWFLVLGRLEPVRRDPDRGRIRTSDIVEHAKADELSAGSCLQLRLACPASRRERSFTDHCDRSGQSMACFELFPKHLWPAGSLDTIQ